MLEQRSRCVCGTYPWEQEDPDRYSAIVDICPNCRKRELAGENLQKAPKAESRGARIRLKRQDG